MSSDCLFCKIASGEINASFVHQDENVIAINDINPQAPVHVLVLPRQHIPAVTHVNESDSALLMQLARTAQSIAREKQLGEGFRLVINTGPAGGQTVDHLHIHLLGGRQMTWPPG